MNIHISYFGQIAEITGKEIEQKEIESSTTLSALEANIVTKYELSNIYYRIALNNQLVAKEEHQILKNNDELAFMPPFAGG